MCFLDLFFLLFFEGMTGVPPLGSFAFSYWLFAAQGLSFL